MEVVPKGRRRSSDEGGIGVRWAVPHLTGYDFAAERPVRMGEIGENDRQDDHCPDAQDAKAFQIARGLPDRDLPGHDVGPETDGETTKSAQEQHQPQSKRQRFVPAP
jgi:hypothetical protein